MKQQFNFLKKYHGFNLYYCFYSVKIKGCPACLQSPSDPESLQETCLYEIDTLYCIKTNTKETDFLIAWSHISKLASQAVIQQQPPYFKDFYLKKKV